MKNKSKQSVHSYSAWSNYGMAFVWMREREGGSYYFLSALFVAIAVIHPFLAMALPGAVVYLLGSGWIPERIFLVLAGYVIVLQGMQIAKGYLDGRCKKRRFLLRIHLGDQYFGAAMDADYQEFESESGQKKLQSAKMNLYYGGEEPIDRPGQIHEIRLEHVSFRYGEGKEDTIRDLSLTITPGEKIALVGMNGAGKSTLIKLICGLYRPDSGKIYLDGKDISLFSGKDYFREFAVVFQEVFAFSFSVEDNISCKEEASADKERLKLSLTKAGLWERVQNMEKKELAYLNKDIDPSGVTFSGGELQRLMLARALYKDASVLILDEPTAALDPLAESKLYEKYYDMTKDKTSIFISHRLSSTQFCDRILYMENGRITEEGGHEELMAKQGAYAAMFHTQAQYYEK